MSQAMGTWIIECMSLFKGTFGCAIRQIGGSAQSPLASESEKTYLFLVLES